GTAGYAAPEQIRDAKSAGPPADVFALGAILYECLTGESPFTGDSTLEVLQRVDAGVFAPLRAKRPDAPRWLGALVARALARDPRARFEDGGALEAALAAERAGSRRSGLVVLAVLGALGAVAAGGALAVREVRARHEAALRAEVADLCSRATRAVEARDAKTALELARRAVALAPDSAAAWCEVGYAEYFADDRAAALRDLDHALALDARFEPAWRRRSAAW